MDEIERLKNIRTRIWKLGFCIRNNEVLLNLPTTTNYTLIQNIRREIRAAEKAISTYKKIFNQQLEKMKYRNVTAEE